MTFSLIWRYGGGELRKTGGSARAFCSRRFMQVFTRRVWRLPSREDSLAGRKSRMDTGASTGAGLLGDNNRPGPKPPQNGLQCPPPAEERSDDALKFHA